MHEDVARWLALVVASDDDIDGSVATIGAFDATRDSHHISRRASGDTSWLPAVVCLNGSGFSDADLPVRTRRLVRAERARGLCLRHARDVVSDLALTDFPQAGLPPTTDVPPSFPSPSADLQRRVSDAHITFDNTFTRNADLTAWRALEHKCTQDALRRSEPSTSRRRAARFGKSSGELRVGTQSLHPLINECVAIGLPLRLDKRGEYQVVDPARETIVHGFDGDLLASRARALGVPDLEILSAMSTDGSIGGYRDNSPSTPGIGTFSTNQDRVLLRYDGFLTAVRAEVDANFFGPPSSAWSSSPHLLPPHIISFNQADKLDADGSHRGDRVLGNRTGSRKLAFITTDGNFVDGTESGAVPISSNANTDRSTLRMKFWLQIEHVGLSVCILGTAAAACGFPVKGRIFDLTAWFKQLGVAIPDWWKSQFFIDGRYLVDLRDAMGAVSAADHGQRTSSVLCVVVYSILKPEIEDLLRNGRGPAWDSLRRWVSARAAANCPHPLPWFFRPFQDDFSSICVSDELAAFLDVRVPQVFTDIFQVSVSNKASAARPHDTSFTVIGADFDTSEMHRGGSARMRPRAAIADGLRETIRRIRADDGAHHAILENLCGTAEFCVRFADDVDLAPLHRARASAAHHDGVVRVGTGPFRDVLDSLVDLVENRQYGELTVDPAFMCPAHHGCHGDASTRDGYGATVDGAYCFGPWPPRIKALIDASVISISVLELLVATLVLLLATHVGAPDRFIIFSDSESSVIVSGRRRAHKRLMAFALVTLRRAQQDAKVAVWLVHVDGASNEVADHLSHGNEAAACRILSSCGFAPRRTATPSKFFSWLDHLSDLASSL